MSGRDDSELDKAVEAWREAAARAQLALLDDDAAAVVEAEKRGKGRPAGARNLRSEAYANLLIGRHGDPLEVAARVAAVDVLDEAQVERLARLWGCKRHDAVKLWAQVNRDVQPYLHQQLPRAIVLNPGAPGGDRVLVDLGDGEWREVPAGPDGSDDGTAQ